MHFSLRRSPRRPGVRGKNRRTMNTAWGRIGHKTCSSVLGFRTQYASKNKTKFDHDQTLDRGGSRSPILIPGPVCRFVAAQQNPPLPEALLTCAGPVRSPGLGLTTQSRHRRFDRFALRELSLDHLSAVNLPAHRARAPPSAYPSLD
jgi:hypothetical protein